MGELAQGIAHHGVAPAGQIFKVIVRYPAHCSGFEQQHYAQLRQQAADAIDQGGALLDVALACAVHEQAGLLLDTLEQNKTHVGTCDGFSDGRSIGCIILTALAVHAVKDHELARHQAHGMAEFFKLTCPLMGAAARLHADQTWVVRWR